MRIIKQTTQFKKDLRREAKKYKDLSTLLMPVLEKLTKDIPLPLSLCDHALIGNKKNFRDCHLRPDLILLYQKPDEEILILVRLGSHSELSL